MCGIVGYIGPNSPVPIIIEGLRRLEYRGYDSAGIAVAGGPQGLELRRAPGKLRNLEAVLDAQPLHGTFGIGHTRWATHGRPTEENAHPHRDGSGTLVVVHNGIVENYLALKHDLISRGHKFVSETDTEIIAHVIEDELNRAQEEQAAEAATNPGAPSYATGVPGERSLLAGVGERRVGSNSDATPKARRPCG
jgi:glucosamine--fructose-6-phosphate aminotransferase (isomerizing)